MNKLNSFHHECMRAILGIANSQQWEQKISSTGVKKRWQDEELRREGPEEKARVARTHYKDAKHRILPSLCCLAGRHALVHKEAPVERCDQEGFERFEDQ